MPVRSCVDSGGEMFTSGGNFELSGTIGQPDAGQMSGGDFTLAGGFWPGASGSSGGCVRDPEWVCDGDTDGDGLFDGAEVGSAVDGCPDPLNADSDGDTISDGNEVAAQTNPCNADTDGDGVPDNEDPTPTEPGVTTGYLEDTTRDLASEVIATLPLDTIAASGGGNGNGNGSANAKITRRNRLVSWTTEAANQVADGDFQGAIDELEKVLRRVDGDPSPPDWLEDGQEKDDLRSAVEVLIALLQLEL